MFDDPRTVIARTLGSEISNSRTVITLTLEISEALAQWLLMQANTFDAFDERTHGYQILADRLTQR